MFKAGEVIGEYEIHRLIGVGFMGEVYHAVHRGTGQAVALKCLQVRHLENAELVERARREAAALSAIRHANIVYVHEAGVTDTGVVWMAMELLVGRSLRRVMKDHGKMPVPLAMHYTCEIADGVDAAHEHSIVHRDLKPENVFVTDSNEVRVLDLGTAKFFGQGLDTTGRAQVFGTVPYMSPEHLAGERVDARTDVYALGMLLYEMIAGEHPFKAQFESILELGRAQMFQMPKPLYDVVPETPGYVWSIIEKAISKDREKRHLSMSDFARALRTAKRRFEQEMPDGAEARAAMGLPALQPVPSQRSDYMPPQVAPRQSAPPIEPPKKRQDGFTAVPKTLVIERPGAGRPPTSSDPGPSAQQSVIGPYGTQVIPPDVRAAMVANAYASAAAAAARVSSPSSSSPPVSPHRASLPGSGIVGASTAPLPSTVRAPAPSQSPGGAAPSSAAANLLIVASGGARTSGAPSIMEEDATLKMPNRTTGAVAWNAMLANDAARKAKISALLSGVAIAVILSIVVVLVVTRTTESGSAQAGATVSTQAAAPAPSPPEVKRDAVPEPSKAARAEPEAPPVSAPVPASEPARASEPVTEPASEPAPVMTPVLAPATARATAKAAPLKSSTSSPPKKSAPAKTAAPKPPPRMDGPIFE
jgi:serine/threonine-protein kinase